MLQEFASHIHLLLDPCSRQCLALYAVLQLLNFLFKRSSLVEGFILPNFELVLLFFKHLTECLNLHFCEGTELDLFLLVLEGGVCDQLRMVHLQDLELLVGGRQLSLKLLTLEGLYFLDFAYLSAIYFVELNSGVGLGLLDLVVELLDLVFMLVL